MPKKKNKKMEVGKKDNMKYVFVIGALFVFSLIVLITPLTFVGYSLTCSEEEGKIVCEWKACSLKTYPDKSEITIARPPSYVEVVEVKERSGSVEFSPSPFAGNYTALLSCENGDKIFRLTVS
jgi:hypothetical protein